MSRHKFALSSSAALALLCGSGMVEAAVGDVVVVAEELLSPRGLDFAPNGQLFVTEAGVQGTVATAAPCISSPFGAACYTETGAITLVDSHGIWPARRVVTELPVYGDNGPADISFLGMTAYVVVGLGADPTVRTTSLSTGAKAADLDSLIRVDMNWHKPHDDYTKLADIGAYELDHNPDGAQIDSNAFGVLALPGRRIVVDAGANALLEVKANGNVRTLAMFPATLVVGPPPDFVPAPRDRVPSRVTLGPDGYFYVGEEAFGADAGAANVYRVPPNGCLPVDECEVFASGFTNIMDLEFDRNGNLYVLEYGPGDLIKVDRRGTRKTTVVAELESPGGLALSPNGDYAYVSNRTACFGVEYVFFGTTNCAGGQFGEVLRVSLTAPKRWPHHAKHDRDHRGGKH